MKYPKKINIKFKKLTLLMFIVTTLINYVYAAKPSSHPNAEKTINENLADIKKLQDRLAPLIKQFSERAQDLQKVLEEKDVDGEDGFFPAAKKGLADGSLDDKKLDEGLKSTITPEVEKLKASLLKK